MSARILMALGLAATAIMATENPFDAKRKKPAEQPKGGKAGTGKGKGKNADKRLDPYATMRVWTFYMPSNTNLAVEKAGWTDTLCICATMSVQSGRWRNLAHATIQICSPNG